MILPPVTTEHFLQHCPLHVGLRGDTWPENRHLREKLLGDFAELKKTAAFVRTTWGGRLKEAIDDDEEEDKL